MNHSNRKRVSRYIAASAFVLIVAGLMIWLRGFTHLSLVEKYLVLCDAFTIPGILLILLGAMVWVSDLGAMYGIGYVLNYARKSVMHFIVPGALKEQESYFDYVERKKSEGHTTGYGFLFIVGGISMLISFVFMFLFYQLY